MKNKVILSGAVIGALALSAVPFISFARPVTTNCVIVFSPSTVVANTFDTVTGTFTGGLITGSFSLNSFYPAGNNTYTLTLPGGLPACSGTVVAQ